MGSSDTHRGSRFLGMPTSRLGRTTAWVFLASIVLVFLNTVVVLPITERKAGLDTVQKLYNVIAATSVFAAGIVGLLALVRGRERSWAVILPVVFMIAALAVAGRGLGLRLILAVFFISADNSSSTLTPRRGQRTRRMRWCLEANSSIT